MEVLHTVLGFIDQHISTKMPPKIEDDKLHTLVQESSEIQAHKEPGPETCLKPNENKARFHR